MIRIEDKFNKVTLYFPKLASLPEEFFIILRDGVGNEYWLEDRVDAADNPNFITVELPSLDTIPDGEYTYEIEGGDTGLILIGNITPEIEEYKPQKELIEYEG